MDLRTGKRSFLIAAAIGSLALATAPAAMAHNASRSVTQTASEAPPVSLSMLVDDSQASVDTAQAVIAAFHAKYPNITVQLETRPGGTDGDNIVKTRLATKSMNDVFFYNSGSLFQALDPTKTLVDLSDQPFVSNLSDAFISTVKAGDGVYGVPYQTAMGGGILYNKKVFDQVGVKVPTTWEEFAANNDKIKAAGIAPVGQTYADTWTSQLFVLADYCNVQTAVPDFATKYTANQAHYADTPAALAGFQHLEEGFQKGWWQEDFGSAKFDDGLNLLAEGKIAQYPMLTFPLSTIAANHPEAINDIGYFGQPGTDAAKACATIWEAAAVYIPQTTQHLDEAKKLIAFIASKEGTDAITAAIQPTGPYVTKDATLPADVLPAVNDIQAYIASGNNTPALEFLSPIKGPNLENITVAVGSGLTSAQDGATQYDADVVAQAQQLGLPGW